MFTQHGPGCRCPLCYEMAFETPKIENAEVAQKHEWMTDGIALDASERILAEYEAKAEHNWTLLRHLDSLAALGYPLLLGPSRKRFLGALLAGADGSPRDTDGRDVATSVLSALFAERGVWGVRVHDVQGTVDALKVSLAMRSEEGR